MFVDLNIVYAEYANSYIFNIAYKKSNVNCYIKKNDATVDITIIKSITIAIIFPAFSLFMFDHLETIIL